MANILLTLHCNNDCPYCFARSILDQAAAGAEMTLEELAVAVDYVKRDLARRPDAAGDGSETQPVIKNQPFPAADRRGAGDGGAQARRVRLLGGEPTLHRRFAEALDLVLDAGLEVMLLTNGRFGEGTRCLIAERLPRVFCAINVNHPDSYAAEAREQVARSLEALVAGGRGAMSVNVHEVSFDFAPFLEVAASVRPRFVRLDISRPVVNLDNRFIPLEGTGSLPAAIADFARALAARGIPLQFDCPLAFCFFGEEERRELIGRGASQLQVGHRDCHGVIDIAPGLQVWRCFPVAGLHDTRLTDFAELSEVTDYFDRRFAYYQEQAPPLDGCAECPSWPLCLGGCLAHKIRGHAAAFGLSASLKKAARYEQWKELSRAGRGAEALAAYEGEADQPDPLVSGYLRLASGRTGEAVDCLSRVPESHPDAALAALHLGRALARESRAEEAVAAFRRGLGRFPERTGRGDLPALLRADLGGILCQLGRYEEGLEALDGALREVEEHRLANPDKGTLNFWIGLALSRLGRPAEALGAFERAAEWLAGRRMAGSLLRQCREEIARCHQALGRPEEAERLRGRVRPRAR